GGPPLPSYYGQVVAGLAKTIAPATVAVPLSALRQTCGTLAAVLLLLPDWIVITLEFPLSRMAASVTLVPPLFFPSMKTLLTFTVLGLSMLMPKSGLARLVPPTPVMLMLLIVTVVLLIAMPEVPFVEAVPISLMIP